MRIGIVSAFEDFADSPDRVSGGGTHITMVAKKWKEMGENIRFFGRKANFSFWSNSVGLLGTLFDKSLKDESENFDILLAASPYPLDFISFLRVIGNKYRKGCVYFHHLPPPPWWEPFRWGAMVSILNYFYFHSILVVCKVLGIGIFLDHPESYRVGHTKLLKLDAALTQKKPIPCSNGKDIDIFFIGGLRKSKGVIDLVKAVHKLETNGYDLKTVIAGPLSDKRYYFKILRYISRKRIEGVRFLGKISENEKVDFFCRSKIFVFPSYVEGWSLSVMEAAYYGVPIVAYDLSAYSYLENNFTSVKPGRIDELAQAIESTITDTKRVTELANKARILVKKYNYDEIARYQLGIFYSISNE